MKNKRTYRYSINITQRMQKGFIFKHKNKFLESKWQYYESRELESCNKKYEMMITILFKDLYNEVPMDLAHFFRLYTFLIRE